MIETTAETGSTNTDLLDRLQAGERIPEGMWLVADRQTAGRGRQGRAWSGGQGNFMGSTVVHRLPGDPPAPTLALIAGLVLHEAATPLVPDASRLRLKWPNDLLYSNAKLAGILLERQGSAVVVGIGVNLAVAPDLPDRQTCTFAAFGPAPDRDLFAATLAQLFDRELARWRTFGLEPMIRRWSAAALPSGTALTVHDGNAAPVTGTFAGLAPDGSLLLHLSDGATRAIHAGDVMLADERI
ncbi:MAG: biotin--[acetyl-CoA-carboxylase] ligase [Sphingomonadaceae bacterium]